MRIKREHLDRGMEIDFTANFTRKDRIGRGRVSLRKRDNKYQVYVYWFIDKHREDILFESEDLKECIEYTNSLFGYDDVVIEEVIR